MATILAPTPPSRALALPSLVELVGPAGAGKSTLLATLLTNGFASGPRYGGRLTVWGLPRRHLLHGAVEVAPVAAAAALGGQPLRRRELAQMVRVHALREAADEWRERTRHATGGGPLLLLDEGPLFGLAWLDVFFARDDAGITQWRRRVLRDWASRFAAVVRVDAADRVLARRIRTRAQAHPVKADSDAEIARFTARFRRAFDRVLAELDAVAAETVPATPVRVVHVRTDEPSSGPALARVHRALEEAIRAR